MTPELVREVLQRATLQAFDLGVRHAKSRGRSRTEGRAIAVTYAELLVLPVVEVAIEQAVEETAITVERFRATQVRRRT